MRWDGRLWDRYMWYRILTTTYHLMISFSSTIYHLIIYHHLIIYLIIHHLHLPSSHSHVFVARKEGTGELLDVLGKSWEMVDEMMVNEMKLYFTVNQPSHISSHHLPSHHLIYHLIISYSCPRSNSSWISLWKHKSEKLIWW